MNVLERLFRYPWILFIYKKKVVLNWTTFLWQGHKDLNPEPTVLETAALPIELYPYVYIM